MDELKKQIATLGERLKAIDGEQAAIEDAAEQAGKFSDEQRSQHDKLGEEYNAKSAELERCQADLKRLSDRKNRVAPNVAIPRAAGPNSTERTEPQFGRQKLSAADDPEKRGFKDHKEFLSAVMDVRPNYLDERLNLCISEKSAAAGSDEHGTYSDPYGGFLIPPAFAPNLLTTMAEGDPITSLVQRIPMTSPTVKMTARVDKNHATSVSGGLQVTRNAETQEPGSSRMKLEQVTLEAHSLFGLAYASEELLARSPMSFIALLDAGFRDEFASKLVDERLNGSGVGMMEGVTQSPCTITVSKESGQAADTIVFDNIVNMRSRCWGYGRAIWLANHDCLPQLMKMNQAVGTGGVPAWQPSGREDHPDTLLGRPCYFTEHTKTIGDLGDIVLGNWSQYLEGTLTGLSQAESMHVRFLNHERTFKFWLENDGRCWWRSPLTPKNGAATLSPFVILEAR